MTQKTLTERWDKFVNASTCHAYRVSLTLTEIIGGFSTGDSNSEPFCSSQSSIQSIEGSNLRASASRCSSALDSC